ncbi:MAG: penicillin-binding protein 1C [Bacteroidales bacterium]|nr:penicillin-binding protein 1C [Bacteroidales bacterium]
MKFNKQTIISFCLKHRLNYPKPRFWIISMVSVLIIGFYSSLPKPLFQSSYSTVIEDANGNFLSAKIASDYQWRFPQSDTIPYKFEEAIRCFEDEYFYYHLGINPASMSRALWQNSTRHKVVSGGSTLTMQVIRLSRGNRSRNIFNKMIEMVLAFRLELSYSKEEILNLYASHAPFGGNVVGLEAASWRYFGRSADRLSWGETAALAVLPNAPALIFPGKNHDAYLKKRNRLLDKLYRSKIIDQNTCELAKSEPLPLKPRPLPNYAPHLLEKCLNDGNQGKRIRTTVDSRIQQRATAIATKYARYYASNYVNNIAVMVIDTKTGEIKAYVGNAQIPDRNTNQYVDNVVSKRSSGSILKPFLYAAMLHEGELLPSSLVSDIPTRIGSYAPENFEKTYDGAVPADLALAHSLNIPAVRELQQFGVDRFYNLLHNVGFTTINQSSDYYGLSLILGGAEVSLWETTAMYASLGRSLMTYNSNSGKYSSDDYRPATYFPYRLAKSPELLEHSMLSAGALWYTMEALSTVNRPWGEIGWDYFASMHKIAWKTGTSFGQRDAWSVGVTPQYTIGVWVGNSTGEGRPGLTGVSYAAPVMFELFKSLNLNAWFRQPISDLVRVAVCKQSGYRATDNCEAENRWVPRQGVKVKACPFHQSVFLDETETHRVTGNCYPVSSMHIVPWFVLPPAQEYFFKRNHPEYRQLPPYLEGCAPPREHVLDILEPDNNSAIYIPKGLDGTEGMLIFEAVHRNPDATLFWHVDGNYITSTKGIHKIEISPSIGKHTLVVEDEAGNLMRRTFRILSK